MLYMVRFCSKIKARPALVPWLFYLLIAYGGSVIGSSVVLFHDIDARFWYALECVRACVCVRAMTDAFPLCTCASA
jgi:hypothetical protein